MIDSNYLEKDFTEKEELAYVIACCYKQLGDYAMAAEYYQYSVDGWPNHRRAYDAQYRVAVCHKLLMESGQMPQAEAMPIIRSACEKVISNYPDSAAVNAAKNTLKKMDRRESRAREMEELEAKLKSMEVSDEK